MSDHVAVSPDGKYILSAVANEGKESLWLRNIPTNSDTQVVACRGIALHTFCGSLPTEITYTLCAGKSESH